MNAPCNDCGIETEPWPPHRGTQEHYIVKDEVWAAAGMPPGRRDPKDFSILGGGTLCVGCLEKRLGQYTPRLVSRLGLDPIAIAQDPLPDHVVKKWAETTLRNVIKDQGGQFQGLKRVEINGEEIVLIFRREAVQYRAGPGIKAMIADLRWDRIRPGTINLDLLAWENEQ